MNLSRNILFTVESDGSFRLPERILRDASIVAKVPRLKVAHRQFHVGPIAIFSRLGAVFFSGQQHDIIVHPVAYCSWISFGMTIYCNIRPRRGADQLVWDPNHRRNCNNKKNIFNNAVNATLADLYVVQFVLKLIAREHAEKVKNDTNNDILPTHAAFNLFWYLRSKLL